MRLPVAQISQRIPSSPIRQIYCWKKSPGSRSPAAPTPTAEWKKFWADANALQKQAGTKLK